MSIRTDNRRRLGYLKRRGCIGKQRRTPQDAEAYAARARERGVVLSPYPCRFCQWWHVGKDNGKGR